MWIHQKKPLMFWPRVNGVAVDSLKRILILRKGQSEEKGEFYVKKLRHLFEITDPMMRDRTVLDIGSIGHHFEERRREGTFYLEHFSDLAAYAKGIDILTDAVSKAQAAGFNVEVGNAETFTDDRQYDVIFAGELIEHVNNAGNFLDSSHRNLKTEGVLILTTPNAFSIAHISKSILSLTNEPPVNNEHTCYYTPQTLRQLVERRGFKIDKIFYQDYDYGNRKHSPQKKLALKFNATLSSLFPQFSQSFIAVLKKTH